MSPASVSDSGKLPSDFLSPLICIVTHLIITFYLTFTSRSHTSDVNEQQHWGSYLIFVLASGGCIY